MTYPFADTNLLISLLTNDDLKKQAAAAAFFEKVTKGEVTILAPDTVIADAVFVLSSPKLYNMPRSQIRDTLTTLVKLPHFKIQNKQTVLKALEIYGSSKLDFGDAMIIALMEHKKSQLLYSYDTDFDKIPGIKRQEP